MDLLIDTSPVEFQATKGFEPRLDKDGVQRRDRNSANLPLWAIELVVWGREDDDQTEKILATVAADNPPKIAKREFVKVERLRAIPWVSDNGNRAVRVAFRAASVTPTNTPVSSKPASPSAS